jgi:hypothetical protein
MQEREWATTAAAAAATATANLFKHHVFPIGDF